MEANARDATPPREDLGIHGVPNRSGNDDMFRTTPLWGLGQRRFFLHDGCTDDLLKAIQARHSYAGECDDSSHLPCYGPSEANTVLTRFNALSEADKQAILDFL
jgi:CxxC motif-containing protein (DUF1111 family)